MTRDDNRNYLTDRAYTDSSHILAEEKIYKEYGIEIIKPITQEERIKAYKDDVFKAIDYEGRINALGQIFYIQERTRDYATAKDYNDISLRWSRENNVYEDRKKSELFKMLDYFTRNPDDTFVLMYMVRKDDDIVRHAFVDLNKLCTLIKNEKIIIDPTKKGSSYINYKGQMVCPVIHDRDGSAEFTVFNIEQLVEYFPGTVIAQKGFKSKEIQHNPANNPRIMFGMMPGSAYTNVHIREKIISIANENDFIVDNATFKRLRIEDASELFCFINHKSKDRNDILNKFPNLFSDKAEKNRELKLEIAELEKELSEDNRKRGYGMDI